MASVREPCTTRTASADRLHTEDFAPRPGRRRRRRGHRHRHASPAATQPRQHRRHPARAGRGGRAQPEFGCRMGICFSCTQVKTSGCTRNIRSGELNSRPRRRDAAVHHGPGRRRRTRHLSHLPSALYEGEHHDKHQPSQPHRGPRSTNSAGNSTPSASASSTTSARKTATTSTRSSSGSGRSRSPAAASLYLGFLPPFWLAGTAALSLSKILDNMEIGHNVMHGQYDWMRDPALNSKRFEWDTACPGDQWRHSHNYMHHTYTNILDKDRDIGYGILRMDEIAEVEPVLPGQPGVRVPADDVLPVRRRCCTTWRPRTSSAGKRKWSETKALRTGQWRKAGRQTLKDYVLFPALTGPLFLSTLTGERHREPGPQHVGLLDHLLRALPERASPPSPRRRPRTRPAASGTCAR